jgi:hypothetical protein
VNVDKSTLGKTKPFPVPTEPLLVLFEEASINAEPFDEEIAVPVILTCEDAMQVKSNDIINNIFFISIYLIN